MALVILLVVPGWHWWSSWWSLGGPWGVGVGEILPANHCEFRNNLFAISGSATGASQQAHCTRAAGVKSYWQGYQQATQSFLALAGPAWFCLAGHGQGWLRHFHGSWPGAMSQRNGKRGYQNASPTFLGLRCQTLNFLILY